jgi:hypothetical protein
LYVPGNNPGFGDVSNFAFESIKLWWELDFFGIEDYPTKGVEMTRKFFHDIGDYYTGPARFMFTPVRKHNIAALESEVVRIMQLCQFDYQKLAALIKENDARYLI